MRLTCFLLVVVVLGLIVLVIASKQTGVDCFKSSDIVPPKYILDLDLQEEKRWLPILQHFKKDALRQVVKNILGTHVPEAVFPFIDLIGSQLNHYMPAPYAGEIHGIANYMNISVGEILALNIIYELTAFCTSIVAVDKENTVFHGRNLDYQYIDSLKEITVMIDFQRNNKTVFTSTSFVGNVGVFTGMKPNAFTISFNERDNHGSIYENLYEIMKTLVNGHRKAHFVSFLAREALLYDETFDAALQRLAYSPIIAPVYYIIGGVKPHEGAVITRDRISAVNVYYLYPTVDRWFILETNYDRWNPVPPSDDRRSHCIASMNHVGRGRINNDTMFQVLSQPPVLNNQTIYTTLMSAAKPDIYQTYIRYIS